MFCYRYKVVFMEGLYRRIVLKAKKFHIVSTFRSTRTTPTIVKKSRLERETTPATVNSTLPS